MSKPSYTLTWVVSYGLGTTDRLRLLAHVIDLPARSIAKSSTE